MAIVSNPPARAGWRAYAGLLRTPGVAPLVAAGLVGRLPLGMGGLAILLLLRAAGHSYGVAGAVVAANALAAAASAPLLGRAIDRLGQARVLVPLAVAFPAALTALAALAHAGASPLVLGACAALAGVTLPPLGACIRTLWPTLLASPDLRHTAYTLEAALQEVFFVAGPLLVAGLTAAISPTAAILAAGGCGAVGTVAFAVTRASRRWRAGPGGERRRGGALAVSGVRTLIAASVFMGAVFGAVEVAMPAFAEHHGTRAAAGLALAAFSLGSLLGGLVAGALPAPRRLARRYAAALALFAVALAPLALAGSLPAMAVLVLVAGLPIAPAFGCAYGLTDTLAPRGATTEAFAWMSTSVVTGASLGTAIGGAVVQGAGVTAALLLAPAWGALAAATAGGWRRTLGGVRG